MRLLVPQGFQLFSPDCSPTHPKQHLCHCQSTVPRAFPVCSSTVREHSKPSIGKGFTHFSLYCSPIHKHPFFWVCDIGNSRTVQKRRKPLCHKASECSPTVLQNGNSPFSRPETVVAQGFPREGVFPQHFLLIPLTSQHFYGLRYLWHIEHLGLEWNAYHLKLARLHQIVHGILEVVRRQLRAFEQY